VRVSSAEPFALNPISSGAPDQTNPSTADRINKATLPTGGHRRKRPPLATRQMRPLSQTDQVMTQIELPPYHRLHIPLDLVTIEIILGAYLNYSDTLLRLTLLLALWAMEMIGLRRNSASTG
jgi:hypothetical protein